LQHEFADSDDDDVELADEGSVCFIERFSFVANDNNLSMLSVSFCSIAFVRVDRRHTERRQALAGRLGAAEEDRIVVVDDDDDDDDAQSKSYEYRAFILTVLSRMNVPNIVFVSLCFDWSGRQHAIETPPPLAAPLSPSSSTYDQTASLPSAMRSLSLCFCCCCALIAYRYRCSYPPRFVRIFARLLTAVPNSGALRSYRRHLQVANEGTIVTVANRSIDRIVTKRCNQTMIRSDVVVVALGACTIIVVVGCQRAHVEHTAVAHDVARGARRWHFRVDGIDNDGWRCERCAEFWSQSLGRRQRRRRRQHWRADCAVQTSLVKYRTLSFYRFVARDFSSSINNARRAVVSVVFASDGINERDDGAIVVRSDSVVACDVGIIDTAPDTGRRIVVVVVDRRHVERAAGKVRGTLTDDNDQPSLLHLVTMCALLVFWAVVPCTAGTAHNDVDVDDDRPVGAPFSFDFYDF
jgi:hypothetical protein